MLAQAAPERVFGPVAVDGRTGTGMIERSIDKLLQYAIRHGLISAAEELYMRNRLLELLGLSTYTAGERHPGGDAPLEEILSELTAFAGENGRIGDSAAAREQFRAAVMGTVTPWPSAVQRRFFDEYASSPEAATDYFYTFCQDVNYISRYRTALDKRWKTETAYGELDITINLAKPEKDPRDIAAARLVQKNAYPACQLCMENEGYAGRADHPARQNLRIIPIDIAGEAWGFQYSPYVYYNEHCIVLNKKHIPMVIDEGAFRKLFSFVKQFPHYFVGSNADLPIVGGSILSHEHFQGGRYTFAMERAHTEREFTCKGYEDVRLGIVKWPMSVIRIAHADAGRLVRLAAHILAAWRAYSDASVGVYSHTGDTPHNTITPIARMRGGNYELDLVLRNNYTSPEYPMGVFHPHAELHHIKKENIGLIEVMGLAVLPARLLKEMEAVKEGLLAGSDLRENALSAPHADWAAHILAAHPGLDETNIDGILQLETGRVFEQVLEQAGVFKRDETGRAAFSRFIAQL